MEMKNDADKISEYNMNRKYEDSTIYYYEMSSKYASTVQVCDRLTDKGGCEAKADMKRDLLTSQLWAILLSALSYIIIVGNLIR